jgi:membrane-associated protease RseP (regulator of RpoE activity)
MICLILLAALGLQPERPAIAQPLPYPVEDEETMIEAELPAPIQATENVRRQEGAAGAYLGVTFDPEVRNDALVRSVAAGSPAERAGLVAGDVIHSLNGRRVSSYEDVLSAVRWMKPGDSLDIEVSRRVYVRVQPVLERNPMGSRQSAGEEYRRSDSTGYDFSPPSLAGEQLPVPANYQQPTPRAASQYNNARSDQRRYNDASANRRTGDNRNRRSVDRDDTGRNRSLLRRRRS